MVIEDEDVISFVQDGQMLRCVVGTLVPAFRLKQAEQLNGDRNEEESDRIENDEAFNTSIF